MPSLSRRSDMADIEHDGQPMDAGASRTEAQKLAASGVTDAAWQERDGVMRAFVPLADYLGAVSDLLTFAQAVLDLPCPFSRDADPLAAQQRRASGLITTYGGR